MSRHLLVFIVLFGTAACDDGGGGGEGSAGAGGEGEGGDAATGGNGGALPPGDPYDPAAVAGRLAAAACAHRSACSPFFEVYLPQSEAECRAEAEATLTIEFEALVPLLTARRTAFRQPLLDACLAAFEAATADCTVGLDPRDCVLFFEGGRREGQGCSHSVECAEDAWCERNGASCGVCRAVARLGGSCEDNACTIGAVCVDLSDGPTCVPETAGNGGECFTPETGLCLRHLQCVGDEDRTCQLPAGPGQPCDQTGAAPDCDLEAGYRCGAEGTCVEVTLGEEGSACGSEAPTTICGSALTCDTASGQCAPRPGRGAACAQGTCAEGTFCDTGTCRALVASGGACANDAACAFPEACQDGRCGPLRFPVDCGP